MTVLRHLGRGPAFPLRPEPGLAWAEGPEKVEQSMRILLETEPGERVMRPDYGCGLRRFLMSPNSAAVRALIQQAVERALARFERRITAQVQVLTVAEEPSRVDIHIAYVLVRHGKPGNLVYPFYLE